MGYKHLAKCDVGTFTLDKPDSIWTQQETNGITICLCFTMERKYLILNAQTTSILDWLGMREL